MTARSSRQDGEAGHPRCVEDHLGADSEVIVVSNRQPYRHEWDDGDITVSRPTGGLTEGLDAAIRTVEGSWVAWGDGDADRRVVDDDDTVSVPPDADAEEQYTLERLWLREEQVEAYYYGFSNRVLWPVCHSTLTNVHSEEGHWEAYESVNQQFADAVANRASGGDVVWLQDYHFALVPEMLRSRLSDDVSIAHFWHIPWPSWDTFRACPQAEDLLRGLLGNDLFGVHLPRYQQNFLSCVDTAIPGAEIDWDEGRVFSDQGVTMVKPFPLGVDVEHIDQVASADDSRERVQGFRSRHGIADDVHLALGVDRLDYTKGIPARLDALEHLLETSPEWRGALTLVQIGTESRSRIPAYEELQAEVEDAVDRINGRFGTDEWQPVVYTMDHLPEETLYALLGDAAVGIVSPIRDGMNLVAQEFVAAQPDTDDAGVLVLSNQAGVHDLLGEAAVTVSPQMTEEFAAGIETALSMPADERRRRMDALTEEINRHDVPGWIDDNLAQIAALRDENEGAERRV
jgi:trehalose 6-phosphate synthase